MNILITSAGRRVSVIKAFQNEARKLDPDSGVFTVDLNPQLSAASHVADCSFSVPEVTSDSYVSDLIDICTSNQVDLLIPSIDKELRTLAENRKKFEQEGVIPVISDKEFIVLCQDKRKTIGFFEERGICTPQLLSKQQPAFPVYAKPYDGCGGQLNYIIKDESELKDYHLDNEKLLFFEYLDHELYDEYTLDLYYDRHSVLKCVVPRKRIKIREGEVNKALTERNSLISFVKKKLTHIPGARGCLTLQLFLHRENGNISAIEFNPRFGGGYPLSYLAGANYPKWLIEEYVLDRTIDFFDDWEQNLLMLRYDAEILVHDVYD